MTIRLRRLSGWMCALLLVAACGSGGGGGGGGGSSSTGTGSGAGAGTGSSVLADFDSIQANVFDAICTACHVGATAPAGLRLDAANSYGLLVGIPSTQQPGVLRVDPGDPSASYLIQKLEGTAAVGARMPLNGTPLPADAIAAIRQWISDGALQSGAPVPTAPIRVTSMSPLPNSIESQLPTSLVVMFDRELDANTVNETTFSIEASGGDGTFEDGNEVVLAPVSVTVPQTNPQSIVADLSAVSTLEDTYRVTLVGTGLAVIADLSANALDGEFGGAFPSGDGAAGGNFVAEFEVAGTQPTLQSIQDHVFTPICAGCHTGAGATLPGSMNLTTAGASFGNLVGIASVQVPALNRVTAGDADNSYLVHKLEGTQSVGSQMPFGGTPLEQATLDAIRQWIDDGAVQ